MMAREYTDEGVVSGAQILSGWRPGVRWRRVAEQFSLGTSGNNL
jgi:hypothetical protein